MHIEKKYTQDKHVEKKDIMEKRKEIYKKKDIQSKKIYIKNRERTYIKKILIKSKYIHKKNFIKKRLYEKREKKIYK